MIEQDLCRIFRVGGPFPVAGGSQQFIVDATLCANPTRSIQVQTLNAWAASLCQRARDEGLPIVLKHEATKYGATLREAHFLEKSA